MTLFAFCNFPKNMGPVISLLNQATWAPSVGEVNQLQLTASSVVFNPKKDFQSDKCKTQCNIRLKKVFELLALLLVISIRIPIYPDPLFFFFFFNPGYTIEHSTNIQCYFFLITQSCTFIEGTTCGRSLHAHAGNSILFLHDKRSDAVLRILPTRYVAKLCSPSCMSVSNARQ